MRRLLEIQEVDSAIDRLQAQRAELESGDLVRAARDRLDDLEARLGEARLATEETGREQRKLEGDLDMLSQKIRAEERRLYDGSVANAKELESIQHEVAGLRERTARMEDGLLELMERREGLDGQVADLKEQSRAAAEELERVRGEAAGELDEIARSLEGRRSQREALLPAFDEDLLALYEDVRRQKRGVGAAALRDGVCSGCHQALSAVELDRLRRTQGVRRCDNCRRILVFV